MTRGLLEANKLSVRPVFAWYDLWIGVFYDRAKRRLYVLPFPCIGFVIDFRDGGA